VTVELDVETTTTPVVSAKRHSLAAGKLAAGANRWPNCELTPGALERWLLSRGLAERDGGSGLLVATPLGLELAAGLELFA
jgi:hypothetical protein